MYDAKSQARSVWQLSGIDGITYDCLRVRENPIFWRIFPVSHQRCAPILGRPKGNRLGENLCGIAPSKRHFLREMAGEADRTGRSARNYRCLLLQSLGSAKSELEPREIRRLTPTNWHLPLPWHFVINSTALFLVSESREPCGLGRKLSVDSTPRICRI